MISFDTLEEVDKCLSGALAALFWFRCLRRSVMPGLEVEGI